MLNPTLKNGTRVLLQHRGGPVLHVTGVGYDPDTKVGTQRALGELRPGSTLTLTAGDELRGFLISTSPNGNCSVDQAPLLDRFMVALVKS